MRVPIRLRSAVLASPTALRRPSRARRRYATGGLGGVLAGSVVDHTASQGSLTYDPLHAQRVLLHRGRSRLRQLFEDEFREVR